MEIVVLVFGALVIGVVFGGIVARVFAPRVAMISGGILVGLAGFLLVVGARKQGFDGLGYSITALIFVFPAALGSGVVGLVAWYFGRGNDASPKE
ncbi:hypothetical protein [Pararhodobacter sp.]|uniref:hypothetical protein n=1 Tax=Pararhodobacter sp. TaxID=2127056 RepID=UPI002AFEC4DB|nr:hypothetical protein [Pararhodobacter sp.]